MDEQILTILLFIIYLPIGVLSAFFIKWLRSSFYSTWDPVDDEFALIILVTWPFVMVIVIFILACSSSLWLLRKMGFDNARREAAQRG